MAPKRVDFEYNAINQFTKVARYKDTAGGAANEVATSTFAYDTLARLTGLDHKIGTTTIAGYTWQFDVLNRVTQFVSPDGTTAYSYDATGQLTLADHTYQADGSYAHDLNGNRANPGHQTGDINLQRLGPDACLPAGRATGEFGANWTMTYRQRVIVVNSTTTVVHKGTGATYSNKDASGVYTAPSGAQNKLVQNADSTWTRDQPGRRVKAGAR